MSRTKELILVVMLFSAVQLAGGTAVRGAPPAGFVTAAGDQLTRDGEPFVVRGVNYFPKDYAWKMWTSYEEEGFSDQIDRELDEVVTLGFNTVRIFTAYSFFDGTNPAAAVRLNDFLGRLEDRGLLAIVTLFDFYQLYTVDAASQAHVATVVGALVGKPVVLAIDVKNEPDLDYGAAAPRADVEDWLRAMIAEVRSVDPDHLVTIGFSGAIATTPSCDESGFAFDPEVVAALAADVDVVSFHYFLPEACLIDDVVALRAAVELAAAAARPLLLEEFGLHTLPTRTDGEQEAYLSTIFALSKSQKLAGQLIWTLNDFSMLFAGADPWQACFGILRNSLVDTCDTTTEFDYVRKPGADSVRRHNGFEAYLDLFSGWVVPLTDRPAPGWLARREEGVVMRGHDPTDPNRPFWSRNGGHVAVTKYNAGGGPEDTGIARSPELLRVDVDRHPYLTGLVARYEVQDQEHGTDSILHIGVERTGEAPERLLTVAPDTPLRHGFDLDLRQPPLGWSGEQTFRIVLDLDPQNPPEIGHSASYELDCVGLSSRRLAGSCEPSACRADAGGEPFAQAGYRFLQSLLKPDTGLVSSQEPECFTTVYKNALAALAFVHQGDLAQAERIFTFFQDQIGPSFVGFHQVLNACTGDFNTTTDLWVGDNAFLLLALNYYAQVASGYSGFELLRDELVAWLVAQTGGCSNIVAEGTANMYAALSPHASPDTLEQLAACFFGDAIYSFVLDHTVRGALVFGDARGFGETAAFARTDTWQCDESTSVSGYAAFSPEDLVNVEISAQLLTAWRIWRSGLGIDLSFLQPELEKVRLLSIDGSSSGLPFRARTRDFPTSTGLPLIDSTAWLLFDSWGFNPFAPGKRAASEIFSDGFESGDLTKWGAVVP